MIRGRTLAGYVLDQRIAVGGMAEIYRASRPGPAGFAKQVALKIVLPELGRDPGFVRMFLEEARLAARLSSPHLVQVFDAGEEAGTYFLVMEHVDGVDLATLLHRGGALPLAVGLHLGRQLCAALGDLHGATDADGQPLGVVHRDVNPGNVLLSVQGDVKLGDYGIAKARSSGLRTERGTLKGKLRYLSPEQARGEEVDRRADIYGLGLVLFEALTGERFLVGTGEVELLREAARPVFRRPTTIRGELPAAVDEVLARALAMEPSRRYPDARLLDEALSQMVPTLDPTSCRDALARLVRAARVPTTDRSTVASAVTPPRPAGGVAAGSSGPDRPPTEVLAPSGERRRTWPWVVVLASVAGLGIALYVHLARDPRGATAGQGQPVEARPSIDAGAPAVLLDAASVRPLVGEERRDGASPDGGGAVVQRGASRKAHARAVGPDARGVTRDQGVASVPGPDRVDAAAFARRLAGIDRLLSDKGLRAADAPALFSERRALGLALARGQVTQAELDALEGRIDAIVIDRAFVDAKLQRLNRRIGGSNLSGATRARVEQRGQRALSLAVTGRYAEANRELNEIAAIVEK